MPPTRDHLNTGPQVDTGVGSPVADRPDIWEYEGPPDYPASGDTGVGSPPARRPDTLDNGNAFIPPLWL